MAFERLAPYTGVTLNQVVTEFIRRHDSRARSVTFKQLFEQFTTKKKNLSEAYRRGLRNTLPRFHRLHNRTVCDITPAELDQEMTGMTAAVRNAFMRNLKAVFNFGVKRGYLESNPIKSLDFEPVRNGEVVVLTPTEAEALLNAADAEPDEEENGYNDLVPYCALGLFAGIRPQELERLDWCNIDLAEGHITVPAEAAKTGKRRFVDIEPTLQDWLTHHTCKGGSITGRIVDPVNLRKRLRALRKASGLTTWTQDVMRHSYASYWLAKHNDINRLTLAMGHSSPAMLWEHYHRASTRKDAELYWAIAPDVAADGKITSRPVPRSFSTCIRDHSLTFLQAHLRRKVAPPLLLFLHFTEK
jgi:integrase